LDIGDVIVIAMPDINGLAAAQNIPASHPAACIIFDTRRASPDPNGPCERDARIPHHF
jgi:hypothetical protein